MHYLNSLSEKLATAYKNHSELLNRTSRFSPDGNNRMLKEALRSVLEEEVHHGRLRYNTLSHHEVSVQMREDEFLPFPDLITARQ